MVEPFASVSRALLPPGATSFFVAFTVATCGSGERINHNQPTEVTKSTIMAAAAIRANGILRTGVVSIGTTGASSASKIACNTACALCSGI
jgi:hypothetical protein